MSEQECSDENCSNVKHLREIQRLSIQTEHLTQYHITLFLKPCVFEGCLEGQTLYNIWVYQ